MPRLRVSVALSTAALLIATAGTAWLSDRPSPPLAQRATRAVPPHSRRMDTHASMSATPTPRPHRGMADRRPDAEPTLHAELPAAAVSTAAGARATTGLLAAGVRTDSTALPMQAASASDASQDSLPDLQPLQTPMVPMPYRQLAQHRQGAVRLTVHIDAAGRVQHVALRVSSADPVLDDYALRSVPGWQFAPPADSTGDEQGVVTVRFTADDGGTGEP